MRKLIFATLIVAATFGTALPQGQTQPQDAASQNMSGGAPNMGRAPETPNGIGRLDLRVVDEGGAPVKGVNAKLESTRTDGYFCEAVSLTDERGVSQMTLHMGRLMLKLKARGYQTQNIKLFASSLSEPVRVTMVRKK